MASLLTPANRAKIQGATPADLRQLIQALTEDVAVKAKFQNTAEVVDFAKETLGKKSPTGDVFGPGFPPQPTQTGDAGMALNLQKSGIGLSNIREADTAQAAQAVIPQVGSPAVPPAGPGPFGAVAPKPSGTGVQETKDRPGTTPQKDDESDPFGAVLGFLRDALVVVGVPTRATLAKRAQDKQRKQDIESYDMIIKGTTNLISTIGSTPEGPERDQAVDVQIAALNLIQPGVGDGVREAWEAHATGRLNLGVISQRPWVKEAIALQCGTGPKAQACVNKLTTDPDYIQDQDDMHDFALLPDIEDWFEKMGQLAASVDGGAEAVQKAMEGGITVDELRRLPPELQFPEEQLEVMTRSEKIQERLIPLGFKSTGLVRKEAEAAITAPPTSPLTKLQTERAAAEAAGDSRLVDELNKKIKKEITITGRTPEDVRTGLAGATVKDLDALRSGIRDLQSNLNNLEKTRKAFEANPEAGGILGSAIENIGGLLGQIPFIGGDLEDMLPGDAEKVRKARTRARFVVSSMLSTITAEDSGRFTDTERRIASEALGALDITASPRQIQTALETAFEIVTDSQNRKVDELFSASGLDLASTEGRLALHKILSDNGFTSDQADISIDSLMARRGVRFE